MISSTQNNVLVLHINPLCLKLYIKHTKQLLRQKNTLFKRKARKQKNDIQGIFITSTSILHLNDVYLMFVQYGLFSFKNV